MRTSLTTIFAVALAVGFLSFPSNSPAFAATDFANYTESGAGTGSYGVSLSSQTPVTLQASFSSQQLTFLGTLGTPNQAYTGSTFTLNASSPDAVSSSGIGTSFSEGGFNGTITFSNGTNLLTVDFTDATLSGTVGGTVGTLSGISQVVYSTALGFDPSTWTNQAFSLTFSVAVGGFYLSGDYLTEFSLENVSGGFSALATAAAPEPLTGLLMLFGFASILSMASFRRRRHPGA